MYTLVFDLLVRVADVFLELFPLKTEYYDYHNLVLILQGPCEVGGGEPALVDSIQYYYFEKYILSII